jgi:AcrR family transcriptional regulator
VQVIADRIGITAPALYYHFANKQELLYGCLELALSDLVASGESSLMHAGADPRERLRAFARTHVAFHIERTHLQSVYETTLYGMGQLANALSSSQRRRLVELQRRHLDNLRGVLKEGVTAGQFSVVGVTPTAFAIFAVGEHVVSWFKPTGPQNPAEIAELYAELALRMVGVVNGQQAKG